MINVSNRLPIPGYSDCIVDVNGNTFKPDGTPIHQFNSNGYKQILTHSDETGKRKILGVHQAVAMTHDPEYFDGCVVHHIDGDKTNNNLSNLKCETRSEHSRNHADPAALQKYVKEHGSPTKGMKMSQEFCEKCRQNALKRVKNGNVSFHGNQFVDKDGNKKQIDQAAYDKFRENCRVGALNRNKNK